MTQKFITLTVGILIIFSLASCTAKIKYWYHSKITKNHQEAVYDLARMIKESESQQERDKYLLKVFDHFVLLGDKKSASESFEVISFANTNFGQLATLKKRLAEMK